MVSPSEAPSMSASRLVHMLFEPLLEQSAAILFGSFTTKLKIAVITQVSKNNLLVFFLTLLINLPIFWEF